MERMDSEILISLPASLKAQVVLAAKAEELYTNAWIRAALRRALAERARKAERRATRQGERAA